MTERSEPDESPARQRSIQRLARVLIAARTESTAVDLVELGAEGLAPSGSVEANLVDDQVARLSGWPVRGWKIGCTSQHAQQLLGADGPFAGRVYTVLAAERSSGGAVGPVVVDRPMAVEPLLEGEFAFTFESDMTPVGHPWDRGAVLDAVDTVHPAIEFVGGRYRQFLGAPLPFVIADAGANLMLVLGPGRRLDSELARRLPSLPATMSVDGVETGRGTGSDVLGDPVDALVWLVNHLAERHIAIVAGQTVTTGTATQVAPLPAGSTATVAIAGIGSVSVNRR